MAKRQAGSDEGGSAERPDSVKEDEQVVVRRGKLARLRDEGPAFPNDFRRDATCAELLGRFDAKAQARALAALRESAERLASLLPRD